MDSQNNEDQTVSTGNLEYTEKDKYYQEGVRDSMVDRIPADAAILSETPMGGTVAAVTPMNDSIVEETRVHDTYFPQIPMGGTLAAVSPLDDTIIHEEPMEEMTNQESIISVDTHNNTPASELIIDNSDLNKSIPFEPTMRVTSKPETPTVTSAIPFVALLSREESLQFRTRWNEIQGKFVDEPRTAVQQADKLVEDVMEQISTMFSKEHDTLVSQWKQGNDVSTEDLRKALQRYRSFFNRLVV